MSTRGGIIRYIKSTASGKTWRLYAVKDASGRIAGRAVEGEYEEPKEGRELSCFSYDLTEARRVNAFTGVARMTEKAEVGAINAVEEQLRMKGYIQ